ncbi:MAG TPA: sulfotransferase [Steroidobacteraceae bacterium]|nr:sulfotransferase [Steroidobacteraceae bacterium]
MRPAPHDVRSLLARAHALLAAGRLSEARGVAELAERAAPPHAALLDAIGTVYSRANDQQRALAAYDRAVGLAPNDPRFLFNRATVRRFLGALPEAEADYDRVIALHPADYEAYRNRSDLRAQTPERNHTAELEALLARGVPDWRAEVQLRYALAKEYEDLGAYDQSFAQLERGARVRREHLRYNVATDVATVDWIMRAFPGSTTSPDAGPSPRALAAADPSLEAPIFIVGLPRSGSTLVDRILSSHSGVSSAGELHCFAHALVDAVRGQSGGAPSERRDLVARSAHVDFAALGRDYLERARAAGATGARFTDKMPLNYLYCGLIHRALPRARIVHVSRSPMAACYAVYKSLFDEAYPYSYDLEELGRYYVAYRRLMEHWHAALPGAIHELRYEALISDPRAAIGKLLEFCGLEWQEACVEFHRNPAPTTTASAAQVRRPLYETSVAQWRHYRGRLERLSRQLAEAGVPLES